MSKNKPLPTMIVWHEKRNISDGTSPSASWLKVECRMSISEAIAAFRSLSDSDDVVLSFIMTMYEAWLE